jgi:Mor family transcriptional regulator
MDYTEENSADGDIPAIIAEKVFKKWQEGKSLIEIAKEMNLKIAEVKRILKARQKSQLQEGKLNP